MQDDELGETFNQDQQEMFQNPDTNLGETRPRTPGTQNVPALPVEIGARREDDEEQSEVGRE